MTSDVIASADGFTRSEHVALRRARVPRNTYVRFARPLVADRQRDDELAAQARRREEDVARRVDGVDDVRVVLVERVAREVARRMPEADDRERTRREHKALREGDVLAQQLANPNA